VTSGDGSTDGNIADVLRLAFGPSVFAQRSPERGDVLLLDADDCYVLYEGGVTGRIWPNSYFDENPLLGLHPVDATWSSPTPSIGREMTR
jgi:hypothetical protein